MTSRRSALGPPELPWQRLLLGRGLAAQSDTPSWLASSYQRFHELVIDPAYPCYFGSAAEKRGELYYTFVTDATVGTMPVTLETFLASADKAPTERRNLTVFFEPDDPPCPHGTYRQRFWSFLCLLHANDPCAWPEDVPTGTDDPDWEFAFAGRTIFVFGAAPSYEHRASRQLGPGMLILMQPRSSFFGVDGGVPAGIAARRKTRERIEAWDRMAPHPDLGIFGEKNNREWKQYFLPDDNAPENGRCPFRHDRPEPSG